MQEYYNIMKEFLAPLTFRKLSSKISCTLKDGLNGPSVRCRASRATRNTLLVISPEKREGMTVMNESWNTVIRDGIRLMMNKSIRAFAHNQKEASCQTMLLEIFESVTKLFSDLYKIRIKFLYTHTAKLYILDIVILLKI